MKTLFSNLGFVILLASCLGPHFTSDHVQFVTKRKTVEIPSDYYIYPNHFSKEEIQTIHAGFKMWEDALQPFARTRQRVKFNFKGLAELPTENPNDKYHVISKGYFDKKKYPGVLAKANLLIFWEPLSKRYYYHTGGDIVINQNISFHTADCYHCFGYRSVLSECLANVMTHEIGHLLGLEHDGNCETIMYHTVTTDGCADPKPRSEDILSLLALYEKFENALAEGNVQD